MRRPPLPDTLKSARKEKVCIWKTLGESPLRRGNIIWTKGLVKYYATAFKSTDVKPVFTITERHVMLVTWKNSALVITKTLVLHILFSLPKEPTSISNRSRLFPQVDITISALPLFDFYCGLCYFKIGMQIIALAYWKKNIYTYSKAILRDLSQIHFTLLKSEAEFSAVRHF